MKVHLAENMKNDFYDYVLHRTNKISFDVNYNHTSNNREKILTFFDYCLRKDTYVTTTGVSVIAGEMTGCGTSRIALQDGTLIVGKDINTYETREYKNDPSSWIEWNLFHWMFCRFEWLMRCKDSSAVTDYKKIFNKPAHVNSSV